MPSYNKVLLMGHLTRTPESKVLPNGTELCEFGLASNRKFGEREEVLFIDCTAFGKTANVIQEHFTKGKPIFLEGRLRMDSWEDRNGGGKRTKISVVVDNFQFIGGKSDGGGGDNDEPQQQSRPSAFRQQQSDRRAKAPPQPPFQEEKHFGEEDIPF